MGKIDFEHLRFRGNSQGIQVRICGKCPDRFQSDRPETCTPEVMKDAARTGICSTRQPFRPLRQAGIFVNRPT